MKSGRSDLLEVRPEEIPVSVPKFERVAEAIREQIRSGQLKPGDKLPSISQLQTQYEVSYGSIRGAMLVLKAEGLIEGRPGEGVYVMQSGN
jgi:GntR family transcriptional regulator